MSARSDETTQGFKTPHFIQNQILKYMYNICKDKVQFRLKFTLSCGTSVHRVYTLQLSFLRKAFMSPAACCLPLSLPWRLCLPPPSCSSSSSSLATSTLATTGWCHSALLCIGICAPVDIVRNCEVFCKCNVFIHVDGFDNKQNQLTVQVKALHAINALESINFFYQGEDSLSITHRHL